MTTATDDAEAERRLSIEQDDSYMRNGSINSRKSINKKNLSILVPADAPGTEYNPYFKTPTEEKRNDAPAIAPIYSQIAAVATHTLQPSETTEIIAVANDSDDSDEDIRRVEGGAANKLMPSETTEMIALRSDSDSDHSGDGTHVIEDDF